MNLYYYLKYNNIINYIAKKINIRRKLINEKFSIYTMILILLKIYIYIF